MKTARKVTPTRQGKGMNDNDYAKGWNAACCAIARAFRDDAKAAGERETKNGKRKAVSLRGAQHRATMMRLDLPVGKKLKLAARMVDCQMQSERDTAKECP